MTTLQKIMTKCACCTTIMMLLLLSTSCTQYVDTLGVQVLYTNNYFVFSESTKYITNIYATLFIPKKDGGNYIYKSSSKDYEINISYGYPGHILFQNIIYKNDMRLEDSKIYVGTFAYWSDSGGIVYSNSQIVNEKLTGKSNIKLTIMNQPPSSSYGGSPVGGGTHININVNITSYGLGELNNRVSPVMYMIETNE